MKKWILLTLLAAVCTMPAFAQLPPSGTNCISGCNFIDGTVTIAFTGHFSDLVNSQTLIYYSTTGHWTLGGVNSNQWPCVSNTNGGPGDVEDLLAHPPSLLFLPVVPGGCGTSIAFGNLLNYSNTAFFVVPGQSGHYDSVMWHFGSGTNQGWWKLDVSSGAGVWTGMGAGY